MATIIATWGALQAMVCLTFLFFLQSRDADRTLVVLLVLITSIVMIVGASKIFKHQRQGFQICTLAPLITFLILASFPNRQTFLVALEIVPFGFSVYCLLRLQKILGPDPL